MNLNFVPGRNIRGIFGIFIMVVGAILSACGGGGGDGGGSPTPPATPAGLVATPGNTEVTITWNPVSGADSYNLYMASVSGVNKSNYTTLADGMKHASVTSPFVHSSLTNGTTYYFVVTAVNAAGEGAESVQVSATPTAVIPPFGIPTQSLPAGVVDTAYNASLTAANGTQPYAWSVIAGALPTGLTLAATGQISGTPTVAGTFPVTIQAQDSAASPQTVNAPFSITVATVSPPPSPARAVVAAGESHACALANGTVQCWGLNSLGQLGNGTSTSSSTPVTVSGISTATAVAAGAYHTCAVLANGTVQCWGGNFFGVLGNGTTTHSSTPVTVTGISTATAVSAGFNHACAILASGTVQCWGHGVFGELGNGAITISSTPVTVTGITTATAIAAAGLSFGHTCALLANGAVQCWGWNNFGQLGNGATTGNSSTPVTVTGITTATAIAAGGSHTCAILANGTLQCWGRNGVYQLGATPVTVTGITTAVSVGYQHTCAVLTNGTLQCWGRNGFGQLGNGTTTNSSTPVQVIGLP